MLSPTTSQTIRQLPLHPNTTHLSTFPTPAYPSQHNTPSHHYPPLNHNTRPSITAPAHSPHPQPLHHHTTHFHHHTTRPSSAPHHQPLHLSTTPVPLLLPHQLHYPPEHFYITRPSIRMNTIQ